MNRIPSPFSGRTGLLIGLLTLAGGEELLRGEIILDSVEDVYTETFDSLPSSGSSFSWIDDATIPGWFAASSTTAGFDPAGITTGSTTTGDLYSFGASGSSERALGSIGSGAVGDFFWGLKILNNTGTTVTSFTISYTGEQWRRASSSQQAIETQYSLSATNVKTGTYTSIGGLGFISPDIVGSSGSRDGNNGAFRSAVGPVTVNNINWPSGSILWIRFSDPDHSGSDHGLAVDDFSFSVSGGSTPTYDPPVGYYSSAEGLSGQLLADALHSIITPHNVIPYTSTSTDVWDALRFLDEDGADSTKINLTYSGVSILKTDTTWNREHLWPQSRGIDASGPDSTDLFNIRPVYSAVNSSRGNRFFDESDTQDPYFGTPAHSLAALDTSEDFDSWEPGADEKGDIARSLFYMDVRYDGSDSYTSDLVLENQISASEDMAVLSTLLSWHQTDPVSESERKRNFDIYTLYQGNRNPFVDHPEYAELIFGDFVNQSQDFDLDGIPNGWELGYSFNPDSSLDANLDADGDGFSNFEEYWMGSNPRSATDPVTLHVDANYSGSVQDGTITYPFKTINGAVGAVPANDLRAILVKPGTYDERPYITGKANIHLFSEGGADVTIIDGNQVNSSVVRLYDFQRASFVGFTVRNANTSFYGAGLRIESTGGSILIVGNVIHGNSTTNSSKGGGGVYLKSSNGTRMFNNLIYENTAVRGGGILFGGGDIKFWHNTITGNTATGGSGGGLSALSGVTPDVRNNILWANTGSGTTTEVHQITMLSNNIVFGAQTGSGNFNSDPLFEDVSVDNYHITEPSPARNTGIELGVSFDLDWDNRPDVVGGQRDLGADEYVDINTDSDGDSLPDSWELQNFGSLGQDGLGDNDGDGFANAQEYQGSSDPNDFYSRPGVALGETIVKLSGDNQTGNALSYLANPFVVEIQDSQQTPIANAPVAFTVTTGGGSLAASSGDPQPMTTLNGVTNSSGQVSVYYKLGAGNVQSQISVTAGSASVQTFIVDAQGSGNLEISPSTATVQVLKGNTQTILTTLTNDSGADINYGVRFLGGLETGQSYAHPGDTSGNRWSSSDDVNGPNYVWQDISTTGTALASVSSTDDGFEVITLPFVFDFYGESFTQAFVSANGYLTFGNGASNHSPTNLPSGSAPYRLVAGLFKDLLPSAAGMIYWQSFSDRVVIQYDDVRAYSGTDRYTFQIELRENGKVKFNYLNLDAGLQNVIVGVQNLDASVGFNVPDITSVLRNGLSLEIGGDTSWINSVPNTGSLAAAASETIDIVVSPPLNVATGDYSGQVEFFDLSEQVSSALFSATVQVRVAPSGSDTDGDGLPDSWENQYFGNLGYLGADDVDGDGLDNATEYALGTNPILSDTDSDGLNDGDEVSRGTSPVDSDTDNDGISDGEEVNTYASDPLSDDSDGDGLKDGWEIVNGLNPIFDDAFDDSDGDRIPSMWEFIHGTDPSDSSSKPATTYVVAKDGTGTHSTIQSAMNAIASDYAIIEVKSGNYSENLNHYNNPKKLLILGQVGPLIDPVTIATSSSGDSYAIRMYNDFVLDSVIIRRDAGKTGRAILVDRRENSGQTRGRLSNVLITGNTTTGSVLVYNDLQSLELVHCTVFDNFSSGSIGLIYGRGSESRTNIANCILWNSKGTAPEVSGEGQIQVSSSIVRGGQYGGIDQEPDLVGIGYLSSLSAGTNAGVSVRLKVDVHNEQRPAGSMVDLGWDEFFDSDGDDLPDWWELKSFGDLAASSTQDPDTDGLNNLGEYLAGTIPTDSDTDQDGLSDGDEINVDGTDPLSADTDKDVMPDGFELTNGLNPLEDDAYEDKDRDQFPNLYEWANGSDPTFDGSKPSAHYTVDASATLPDFQTLQQALVAVNAAGVDYRIIQVLPGTYKGSGNVGVQINSNAKKMMITSSGGPMVTVFDGENADQILSNSSELVINGIRFTKGYINGSGGAVGWSGRGLISNSVFDRNEAYQGGGVHINGGDKLVRIQDSVFRDNNASSGGGLYIQGGNPTEIERLLVEDNTATSSGGGIHLAGSSSEQTVFVNNSMILRNRATNGGGIYNGNKLQLAHATLSQNDASNQGSALYDSAGATIINSVSWDSSTVTAIRSNAETSVSYSVVRGGFVGPGNIDTDPSITRHGHLAVGSSAIDSGSQISNPGVDFDFESRPQGAAADIGADEWLDANSDGLPDWWENETGVSGSGNDPDVDGINNGDEYANGFSPLGWNGVTAVDSSTPVLDATSSNTTAVFDVFAHKALNLKLRFYRFYYDVDQMTGELGSFHTDLIVEIPTSVPAGLSTLSWDGIDPATNTLHTASVVVMEILSQDPADTLRNELYSAVAVYDPESRFEYTATYNSSNTADPWVNIPGTLVIGDDGMEPLLFHMKDFRSLLDNIVIARRSEFNNWIPFGPDGRYPVDGQSYDWGGSPKNAIVNRTLPENAIVYENQNLQVDSYSVESYKTIPALGLVAHALLTVNRPATVTLTLYDPNRNAYPLYYRNSATGQYEPATDVSIGGGETNMEFFAMDYSAVSGGTGNVVLFDDITGISDKDDQFFRVKFTIEDSNTGYQVEKWATCKVLP